MRRTIGAAILIAAIVLPRVGGLVQPLTSNPTATVNDSTIHVSAPGSARAPAPNAAPPETSRQKHRMAAPVRYLADPLEFLSNAPVDSLVLLPGIGPVIAERIANARTGKRSFTRWEDLLSVRGIGQKKLDRLKRLAHGTNPL